MKEIDGNLWGLLNRDSKSSIVITTNGVIKKNGCAVMGAGLALSASIRFPQLPYELGKRLRQTGNKVYYFSEYRLYTLPTKRHFKDKSELEFVLDGCRQLKELSPPEQIVYLPKIGCGLGQLEWNNIKLFISEILTEDKFIVVNFKLES
jgi:hypothetical protein